MHALTLPWSTWVFWFAPKIPKNEPAPVTPLDTAKTDEADAAARKAARKKQGHSANILTSPTGAPLGDSGQGGQKTLGIR
jgi:hypothetical protein